MKVDLLNGEGEGSDDDVMWLGEDAVDVVDVDEDDEEVVLIKSDMDQILGRVVGGVSLTAPLLGLCELASLVD